MTEVLKLGVFQCEPVVTECGLQNLHRRPNCVNPGILADGLLGIFMLSNITYEHINLGKFADIPMGTLINGSWTGVLGLIANKTIDTVSFDWISTTIRNRHFDLSYPIMQTKPFFVLKKPSQSDMVGSALLLFKVFKIQLWLLIFGSIFIAVLTKKLTKLLSGNFKKKRAQKAVTVGIDLVVFFIMGLYANCLLTQLLHPPAAVPFKDSYEMMEKIREKKLNLVSRFAEQWYIQELKESSHIYFVKLREALRSNPLVINWVNHTQYQNMIENGPYLVQLQDVYAKVAVESNCQLFAVGGDELPVQWSHLIFAKGSPWPKRMSYGIKIMMEKITNDINKFVNRKNPYCQMEEEQNKPGEPLKLVSFSGLYVLFMVAFVLAALVLGIELRSHSKKKTIGRESSKTSDFAKGNISILETTISEEGNPPAKSIRFRSRSH